LTSERPSLGIDTPTSLTPYLEKPLLISGAFIAAQCINLKAQTFHNTASTFCSQSNIHLAADTIHNQQGRIISQGAVQLKAERDIYLEGAQSFHTQALSIETQQDLLLKGVQLKLAGAATLKAGRDLKLLALPQTPHHALVAKGEKVVEKCETDSGVNLQTDGALNLEAGRDLTGQAGQLQSGQTLRLSSGQNLHLQAGQHQEITSQHTQHKQNNLFSSETSETHHKTHLHQAVPCLLKGQAVQLEAGKDINSEGTQLSAVDTLSLEAKGSIHLKAATHTLQSHHSYTESRAGFVINRKGILLGSEEQTLHHTQSQKLALEHKLRSQTGALSIQAGETLHLEGGQLSATTSALLTGSKVEVEAVQNHCTEHQQATSEKVALSVRLGKGLIDHTQNLQGALDQSHQGVQALQMLQASYGLGKTSIRTFNAYKESGLETATEASGLQAQIRLGYQAQTKQQDSQETQAQGTRFDIGKALQIKTTEQALTLQGVAVKAGAVELESASDITIESAQNSHQSQTQQQQEQVGLGVDISLKGAQVGGELGQNQEIQSESTHQHQTATLNAQGFFRLQSGGECTLKGVQVAANQIAAKVEGPLAISSQQDTHQLKRDATQTNFAFKVPIQVGITSLQLQRETEQGQSYSQHVTEQTHVTAEAGGLQITAKESIQLTGATIKSTAVDSSKIVAKKIEKAPLSNQATAQLKSDELSIAVGTDLTQNLLSGLGTIAATGLGSRDTQQTEMSETTAAIQLGKPSQAPETPLPACDLTTLQARQAMVKSWQQLGMEVSGDLADALSQKYPNAWGEDGLGRIALHAGVAGTGAALGKGSVLSAMTGVVVGDLVAQQVLPHVERLTAGMPTSIADSVAAGLTNIAAGVTGGLAGSIIDRSREGAQWGASSALDSDRWNRQLHKREAIALADLMEGKSPEEQQRLREAAAYLTRASKGVPQQDPRRAALQAMEARGKTHTAELRELNKTNLFQYTQKDGFWDWLSRHDEGIERGLGTLQMTGGLAGMVSGSVLMTTGPVGVVLGGGITGLSMQTLVEGKDRAFWSYQHTEGQRVLDALNIDTFPGERNRPLELATELGLMVTPWAAGKIVNSGMRFFKTRQIHKLLGKEGELLGHVEPGAGPAIYTASNEEHRFFESQFIQMHPSSSSKPGYNGTWYRLPHKTGEFGIRESEKHGRTIDFDIPGYPKGLKLHKKDD
jgi:filamentous hemagglutinin